MSELTWDTTIRGMAPYIIVSGPEKLLGGIKGHGGYLRRHRVDARGRKRDPGDLWRVGLSAVCSLPRDRFD